MKIREMTLPELEQLEKEIALAKLQAEKRRIEKAKTEVLKLMDKLGVSPTEIFGDIPKKRAKGSALPDRYVNPEDPDVRWSGHGRKPAWFNDQLAKGVKREDMEI